MALISIGHFAWQVLRTALRNRTPLTGKQLRVYPSQRSRDGKFLDKLAAAGLLEVIGVDEPTEETKKWPVQFRRRYKLTERGEYAAEYGEYEKEVRPVKVEEPPPPVKVGKRRKGAER